MPSPPVVVQTEHLDAEAAAWLGEHARLIVCPHTDAAFAEALREADGLVVRTYTQVNAALLQRAPRLKVVGRAGVGLDNIDVPACRARGVEVVYTPDANTQAVVEYALALMLDALRPRMTLDGAIDSAQWDRLREVTVAPRQISELTVGLLGLGRVGKSMARALAGIGSGVIHHDLLEIPAQQRHGSKPVTLDELFSRADVVSIHIDGRAANRSFVGERLLTRMRAEVLLLNTSRGFVMDNAALARFMRGHPQALACLDVHEPEPFGLDYPLLGLPNVRLYPHLASRTQSAMRDMSWVVRDVLAVLQGCPPRFPAPT